MAKIKLNENEMLGLVHLAMENVKPESKKTIKISLNELKQVVRNVLSEYRSNMDNTYTVQKHYEIETNITDPITEEFVVLDFTIEGVLEYSDMGIGSYEFQGSSGYDEGWAYQVVSYKLLEGSYNTNYEELILNWVKKNSFEIESDLKEIAENN